MIRAIFISKEKDGRIEMPKAVFVVADKGIQGDRYFMDENRKSADYQVTFIESERIDEYNRSHPDAIEYWQPRRNILTRGIDLNALVGRTFRIGKAEFEGLLTCEPCELMKTRTSASAFKWFVGKGGLRARVVGSGEIGVGDLILAEEGVGRLPPEMVLEPPANPGAIE